MYTDNQEGVALRLKNTSNASAVAINNNNNYAPDGYATGA